MDTICDYCFAITRTAQYNAALTLPTGHCFGNGADEERVIYRFIRIRAEVGNAVAELLKEIADRFLVFKSGVV